MNYELNNATNDANTQSTTDKTTAIILASILGKLKKFDLQNLDLKDGETPGKRHLVVSTVELVLKTAEELGYSLTVKNGRVYIYNGQYWKGINQEIIVSFLGKAAEEMGVDLFFARYHEFRTDLYKQFISSSFLSLSEKPIEEVLINLQNGTFTVTPQIQQIRDFKQQDFLPISCRLHLNQLPLHPFSNNTLIRFYQIPTSKKCWLNLLVMYLSGIEH